MVAAGVGNTTGVTVEIYDKATATGAANTVSIASTIAVPTFSSVVIIGKENAIYLEEDRSLGVYCQPSAGSINVIVAYEEIMRRISNGMSRQKNWFITRKSRCG